MSKIHLYHGDSLEAMKGMPDKVYDLAIPDPNYGIGAIKGKEQKDGCTHGKHWKRYERKGWDLCRPTKEYFEQLFRVSKNQIIWGANYFTEFMPPSMGWIFWDKGQELTMSDGELAFTSFDRALRKRVINRCHIGEYGGLLHPTQKPVKLYKWLLKNYAKPGDRILDTHGGSMSIAIACHDLGFDLDLWEIDEDYYRAGVKRFEQHKQQLKLFSGEQAYFGPVGPESKTA